MADVASLGISIDSRQAQEATRNLDGMAKQAQLSERAIQVLADRARISFDEAKRRVEAASQATGEFSREANKAAQSAGDLGKEVDNTSRAASSFAAGFGRAFFGALAGAAAYGAINFLRTFKDELVEIDRLSRITGASLQSVAGLQSVGRMGGLTNDQVNQGARGLAEALREAGREENDLRRLFDANNVALRDRNGQIVNFNQALEAAARLIQNASSELDKIEIARMLGLSEQWVRVLEQGPEALRRARAEAEATGTSIDQELVQRAQEFDRQWSRFIENWTQRFKSAVVSVGGWLSNLYSQMRERSPDGWTVGANGELVPDPRPAPMQGPPNRTEVTVTRPAGARPTIIPTRDTGGGGGQADRPARDGLPDELRRLEERTAAIQAQTNVIGLNTFEREKALAVQRLMSVAARDGTAATADETQRINAAAEAYARVQAAAEQAREAQQQYQQLLSTGRSAFSGFFSEFSNGIAQGKSVWEAFAGAALNALKRIADRVLQMASDGIFNMLFGRQGGAGGFGGGLFGGLFGNLFQGGGNALNLGGFMNGGYTYANGGAFNDNQPIPFAMGGAFTNSIVTKPTLFPFANGTGLMGEAGPEAIMPLRRDASGRLGVAAQGGMSGAVSITLGNVNVTMPAGSTTGNSQMDGLAIGRAVREALKSELPAAFEEGRRRGRIVA